MKAQILEILTEVQQGTKTPIIAQKQLLDLFGVMPRFIITYKNDGFEKELYWETNAKSDVDAVFFVSKARLYRKRLLPICLAISSFCELFGYNLYFNPLSMYY